MDLFDCPNCKQRYVVADAGDGSGWTCPACGAALHLVVRRLPGSADAVATALEARLLDDLPAG